ncbi:hypothetical protein TorRG33x02_012480 [Trema orientale]|uniref:Uncharacterized protein n=1 Tax=Trema orientale TaxID=63057 RepID=A0A2P5FZI6_TREOI|nr:hypothetical protein TorRG33x02_012480 [Trema orientale]
MRPQGNLTGQKRAPAIVPNFQRSSDHPKVSSSRPTKNPLGRSSMDHRFVSPNLDEQPPTPPLTKEASSVEQNQGSRSGIVNHQGSEFEAHPKASRLRYKPIRNYEKMDVLVGKDRATRSHATGPKERQLYQLMEESNMEYEDVNHFDPTEHEVENENREEDELGKSSRIASISTFKRNLKKKKIKENDNVADELKNLRERMNLVAAALEKPRKVNVEKVNVDMEQFIIQEIEKVDDLNLESKVVAYRTLTKDEKAAKAFLAITGELRRIWLKMEFGNDIFEA